MNEFAQALVAGVHDEVSCQECEARLAEYVVDQAHLRLTAGERSALAAHLQTCPHCATAARALRALLVLAQEADLPMPADAPKFDFGFLDAPAAGQSQAHGWDELGRFLLQFSASLLATLQPPTNAPAYSGLKSDEAATLLHEYHMADAQRDFGATVRVIAVDDTMCRVAVAVDIPSRGGWPNLGEIPVALTRAGVPVADGETDAFGKVEFIDIARADLAALTIAIDPND